MSTDINGDTIGDAMKEYLNYSVQTYHVIEIVSAIAHGTTAKIVSYGISRREYQPKVAR